MAIEEPKYTVLTQEDDIEVRQYSATIVAETLIEGTMESAGNQAFRILAGYIFGGNRGSKKIAMTAPVEVTEGQKIAMTAPVGMSEKESGKFLVSFTMPAEFTINSLPEPNDPRVKLREIPAQKLAALRYSGTWSIERYETRKKILQDWLHRKGLKEKGPAIFARYNAPWTPWFLRRNEVLIPLEQ